MEMKEALFPNNALSSITKIQVQKLFQWIILVCKDKLIFQYGQTNAAKKFHTLPIVLIK